MQEDLIWQRRSSESKLPSGVPPDQTIRPPSNATDPIAEGKSPGFLVKSQFIYGGTAYENLLTNWQTHLYGELHKAIEQMSDLPELEPLHLDENVAKRALAVVAFLQEHLRVTPPKILNQDGDAVSLTWPDDGVKKFLTISDDEVDVLVMSTSNYMKCEQTLSEGPDIPFAKFADVLASQFMLSDDVVCRAAVFPRFMKSEVFDEVQFLLFDSKDKSKTDYVMSVVSKHLARTIEQVHKFGERISVLGNERHRKQHGGFIPPNKKNHYLGFYELLCGRIESVEMEFYDIQIGWRPESGCDAHFEVEMIEKQSNGSKSQRRNDRTVATEKFANFLIGPTVPTFDPGSERARLAALLPRKGPYNT